MTVMKLGPLRIVSQIVNHLSVCFRHFRAPQDKEGWYRLSARLSRRHLALLLSTLLPVVIAAQSPEPAALAARAYRAAHEREIIDEFRALLAIPNVAADETGLRRNAEAIAGLFNRRGVRTQLLEVDGAPPVVYGELMRPGATRTIIFYAHYDGQPVEPEKWTTGPPFLPTLRSAAGVEIPLPARGGRFDPEWRLYGRSTSDDKAPILALAVALDALKARGLSPGANVKFFFEGEEEAGSPHLEQVVARYRHLLRGDLWLICDGPVDQTRRPQIYFGVRGVTSLELTVYGPRRELHSGHYGNWAPNPALLLSRLLASMKDEEGRVLIEGFYDGIVPLSASEGRALEEAPDNEELLRRELGIGRAEGGGKRLLELINLPSLNIRGMAAGSVGATSRNVIPATATASLDIRLVKGIDHRVAVARVIDHLRRQGYHVIEAEPDEATRSAHAKLVRVRRGGGYNASRTSMDLELSRQVIRAIEAARGPVIKMPTLGGSVPLYVFTDLLKTPAIGIPIVNHDNNQHSADENIRLQNLWDGIETMAALLAWR
jgi:acetylornithine deacetylase/succinyl-diaminopimelate desuccinylase-like protein